MPRNGGPTPWTPRSWAIRSEFRVGERGIDHQVRQRTCWSRVGRGRLDFPHRPDRGRGAAPTWPGQAPEILAAATCIDRPDRRGGMTEWQRVGVHRGRSLAGSSELQIRVLEVVRIPSTDRREFVAVGVLEDAGVHEPRLAVDLKGPPAGVVFDPVVVPQRGDLLASSIPCGEAVGVDSHRHHDASHMVTCHHLLQMIPHRNRLRPVGRRAATCRDESATLRRGWPPAQDRTRSSPR